MPDRPEGQTESGWRTAVEGLDRLRFPSGLGWNRAGTALAATVRPAGREARESYQSRVWLFPLQGAARQLTEGPGSDDLPAFSPVDDRLAFASDRALPGRMAPYILDGAGARAIGNVPGTVEDIRWSRDGAALIVHAADRGLDAAATSGATRLSWGDEEDPDVTTPADARRRLFRVACGDGATAEIGPADLTVWEFALLGDRAAIALVSDDPSERGWYRAQLARLDFAARTARILYRPQWQLQGPAVDPSGRRAAFLEGWSSDRGLVAGAIRVMDLDSGEVGSIAADTLSDVSWLQWRDAESLWFAGWSRLGSMHGVVRLDGRIEWNAREDAVIGPTSFLGQVTPAPDGRGFAAIREGVGQPPEIVRKSDAGSGWTPLSSLNEDWRAHIPAYPEVRPLQWTGAGGLAMEGLVLVPPGAPSRAGPMIVDIHGGPTWSVKHAFNPGYALPLAAAGYVVFLPNYRGNVGWGQAFTKLNVGDPGGAEFEDILRGIDACLAQGLGREDRLGVTGGSYGGYLTAWAVATTRRFGAAVMVSGIANQWSCNYACNHAFSEYICGGPLHEDGPRRIALERSPLMRLGGATTPTLIIHGREDRCTPVGQAHELYSALLEQGAPAELAVYPREGHGLQERAHRLDAWRRTIGWFDRHLRPAE